MGNFYVNFTVVNSDSNALMGALKGRNAFIAKSKNMLVVADEEADQQDVSLIEELARKMSKELHTSVFAVMNHDDDILVYWLYDKGTKLDSYESNPDYFEDTDDPRGPQGGNVEAICSTLKCHDREALRESLAKFGDEANAFEFERHLEIVKLCGLPECAVGFGYGYALEGDLPEGLSAEDILRVEN